MITLKFFNSFVNKVLSDYNVIKLYLNEYTPLGRIKVGNSQWNLFLISPFCLPNVTESYHLTINI